MSDQSNFSQKKILVLEDDEIVCSFIEEVLSDLTEKVYCTPFVKEARQLCAEVNFDLMFLDYNVKDGVGWPLLEEINTDTETYGKPACVLMSGTVDLCLLRKYPSFLETQFLAKPFNVTELKNTAIKLLKT